MPSVSYTGPRVVLNKEEIELLFALLPHLDKEYDDIRMKFNAALDKEWEKSQYPKGRVTEG
jgi:hypothetical protein